jgi:hypothetical protein
MKPKKRSIGDVGIRLKPNEPNILVNYMKYRKRVQKTKKKKPKRKPTRSTKSVEIKDKKDPFLKIVEDSQDKRDDLIVKELDDSSETNLEESNKPTETRTIHVDNKPRDLSETDPNVKKTVKITASLKPDKKKEGGNIILE